MRRRRRGDGALVAARRAALQQSTPGGDVDVHLLRARNILGLLVEDHPLPLQLRLARNHRIEEFDFSEEQARRLQLQCHAMPDVVDELLESQELHSTQRTPVAPVNADFEFARLVEVDGEALIPGLLRARLPRCLSDGDVVQFDYSHDL